MNNILNVSLYIYLGSITINLIFLTVFLLYMNFAKMNPSDYKDTSVAVTAVGFTFLIPIINTIMSVGIIYGALYDLWKWFRKKIRR